MKRNTEKKEISTLWIVLLTVLLIAFLLEAFMALRMIHETSSSYVRTRSVSELERELATQDYESIVNLNSYSPADADGLSKAEREIRAVGLYYDAAELYLADTAAGKDELAAKQKARMDAAREAMGSYIKEADKVDAYLGLQ